MCLCVRARARVFHLELLCVVPELFAEHEARDALLVLGTPVVAPVYLRREMAGEKAEKPCRGCHGAKTTVFIIG